MARLHTTGHSIHQIAATLDRAPSTVARELTRNASTTQAMPTNKTGRAAGRAPSSTATARYAPRSWRGCNTAGRPNRWPGRLALEHHRTVISHETIYRFIYAQIARKKEYAWRHYLPRAKATRGGRGTIGGSGRTRIAILPRVMDFPIVLLFSPSAWTLLLVAAHLRRAWRALVATQTGRISRS